MLVRVSNSESPIRVTTPAQSGAKVLLEVANVWNSLYRLPQSLELRGLRRVFRRNSIGARVAFSAAANQLAATRYLGFSFPVNAMRVLITGHNGYIG